MRHFRTFSPTMKMNQSCETKQISRLLQQKIHAFLKL